jgi:chaperonin GroEL
MSSISFRKVKSVAKDIEVKGPLLWEKILKTMAVVSRVVGGTLGPGGCPVLIERQETGLPNMVTKDGVTVYRSLGFRDPTMHAIMETARDASVRTADEAGDGTTTATVLSEAIVRYMGEYLAANPKSSPQKVVRRLERFFREKAEPALRDMAKQIPLTPEVQRAVVLCSTNGDTELSDAVLQCFGLTGDAGNVTILEEGGPSGYRVEPLRGYSMSIGFEESMRAFGPSFLNDESNGRVYLDKPMFILYFGQLQDLNPLYPLMEDIAAKRGASGPFNFVIFATGFSDTALAQMAGSFKHPQSVTKVVPMLVPKSPVQNGEMKVLEDLAALTGGYVFDPLSRPLETATMDQLGAQLEYFEAMRGRCNVVGRADEELVLMRVEELERALAAPQSKYEAMMLKERIAKLSGGIAKLTVIGASTGEIREKRDRAEDAVCALRGAFRHGVLPGSAWGLMAVRQLLLDAEAFPEGFVLAKALREPFLRLMENAGLNEEEREARDTALWQTNLQDPTQAKIWNGVTDEFVNPIEAGIVDSAQAVIEAFRNSLSIASLLGTLGGAVVFQRDTEVERTESADAYAFMRNAGL